MAARASSKSGELDDERGPGARQLDQLQLGLDRQAERSLRPDEQAGEVEVECRSAQPRRPGTNSSRLYPPTRRRILGKRRVDLLGMIRGQTPGHAVAGTFQVVLGALRLELGLRERPCKCTRLPSDRTAFSSST